jgi:spore germination protein GerM
MGKYNILGRECEQLYCEGNTLETIQKIYGVSLRTLSIWKNEYNWDIKRKEYQEQPIAIHSKIKKVFTGYLDELLENGIKSNKQSDSIAKLAKAMNTTGGIEDIPSMAVTIMPRFIRHVQKNCKDEEFLDWLQGFVQTYFKEEKEKAYGIE